MRSLLVILVVLLSNVNLAQQITEIELLTFKSSEKIPKHLEVSFSQESNNSSIIIKGYNQKSSEEQLCSWESKISIDKLPLFLTELNAAVNLCGESVSSSWKNTSYNIICKRKEKIKISFLSSRCKREHKTNYFQKNCNRAFSFVLTKDIASELLNSIKHYMENPKEEITAKRIH